MPDSPLRSAFQVELRSRPIGVTRPMPPGDLTRNGVNFQGDIVYAFDFGEENSVLEKYFPDRKFYRYSRSEGKVQGNLVEF